MAGEESNRVKPLRVVIITEEDPFYVYEFFDAFVKDARLPQTAEIVKVLIQHAFREPKWKLARRMLGFWGLTGFVRLCWQYAWMRLTGRSCRAVLEKAGMVCVDAPNVNDPACVAALKELDLDVILSVAAPQIFKEPLLNVPKWGCINSHSGPLPRYRGMMPTFWQMFLGEKRIGVTVHTMAKDIDGGEILQQEFTDLCPGESLHEVIVRTKQMAARMVRDTLESIRDGRVERRPMDMTQASYFSFPKPEDTRKFRTSGLRLR
jgi:methionyl-tRNA formyltransferase